MRTVVSTMRPLSSTSCLFKDPVTGLASIVHMQTPWCRDIHSLFPVPPEEAGEQRTMRCHFLNPFLFCFVLQFFCPTGAFFSPPSPPTVQEAVLIYPEMFLSSSQPNLIVPIFFKHHWYSPCHSGGEEGRTTTTTSSLSLPACLALDLPVK